MAFRVLLTGASGFLGHALVTDLVQLGFAVSGISRQPRTPKPGLTWIENDIEDVAQLDELVKAQDVVINGAAKTWNSSEIRCPESFFGINRDATVALFHAAERAGARLFVQISSTGVFGPGVGVFDEISPCRPINLYEQSKFAAEIALSEAAKTSRMRLIIVRPSNVFGEGHPRQKLLTWLRTVMCGRAVLATNPTKYWTNYIYMGDVTRAIARIVSGSLQQSEWPAQNLYHLNCPATTQQFFEASQFGLGMTSKPYKLPGALLFALGIACEGASTIVGRQLPMNRAKARELTNRQVFGVNHIKNLFPEFPWFGLNTGMQKICDEYRLKGLL